MASITPQQYAQAMRQQQTGVHARAAPIQRVGGAVQTARNTSDSAHTAAVANLRATCEHGAPTELSQALESTRFSPAELTDAVRYAADVACARILVAAGAHVNGVDGATSPLIHLVNRVASARQAAAGMVAGELVTRAAIQLAHRRARLLADVALYLCEAGAVVDDACLRQAIAVGFVELVEYALTRHRAGSRDFLQQALASGIDEIIALVLNLGLFPSPLPADVVLPTNIRDQLDATPALLLHRCTAPRYRRAIFKGGGPRGFAYLGAIERLEASGCFRLADLEGVGGASAGAIVATGVAVGCDVTQLRAIMQSMDARTFIDCQDGAKLLAALRRSKREAVQFIATTKDLYREGGICPGRVFRDDFMESLLFQATGIHHVTFAELHHYGYKDLHIVATDVATTTGVVFSYENSPHVVVADAVRASMSIPVIFQPYRVRHKLVTPEGIHFVEDTRDFVDGGVSSNYPLGLFDNTKYLSSNRTARRALEDQPHRNEEVLGFYLYGNATNPLKECGPGKVGLSIGGTVVTIYGAEDTAFQLYGDYSRTIRIHDCDVGLMDFDLDTDGQQKLVRAGTIGADTFLSERAAADGGRALSAVEAYCRAGGDANIGPLVSPVWITDVLAAFPDDAAAVRTFFAAQRVNVNVRDAATGSTALHTAVVAGDEAAARALLSMGASIGAVDNAGVSAFDIAVARTSQLPARSVLECEELVRRARVLEAVSSGK